MNKKNLDLRNRGSNLIPISNGITFPFLNVADSSKEMTDKLTDYTEIDSTQWWYVKAGSIIHYLKINNSMLFGGIMKNVGTDRVTGQRFYFVIPINKKGWKGKVPFDTLQKVWIKNPKSNASQYQQDEIKDTYVIPQPIYQPIPQQMSQPIPQQMSQPIPQQMSQPIPQQISQPIPQQMSQLTLQPTLIQPGSRSSINSITMELQELYKQTSQQQQYMEIMNGKIEENKKNARLSVEHINRLKEQLVKTQKALTRILIVLSKNGLSLKIN